MPSDDRLLAAAIAAFESAAAAFASARIALETVVDGRPAPVVERDYEPEPDDAACRHVDAVEVTTLGDGPVVYLCPACGDQFS